MIGSKMKMMPFAIVSLLASAAFSLATIPAAGPPLKIAVNTTTIESIPVFAAAAAMAGKVQLVLSPNGRAAMSQLVSGEADLATGSETQALLNSVAEPRLRIIVTLAECRYRIVARRSSGVRRIADLRGKKIAVTMNTSSEYFLQRMLRGVQAQVIGLEGQEMPAALGRRMVDAVAIWEPHAENSLRALGDDAVVFEDGAAYTEQFNLNTRTDVLADREKRAAMVALVREIGRVSAGLRKRPPEGLASLSPKVGLTNQTVTAVWPQFSFPGRLSGKLEMVIGEVEPWVAAAQKRTPRARGELAALIDDSVVEEARR
jgi:sulfonate transport system substrate-binding protein